MDEDPQHECWTAAHFSWALGVAMPSFLIWGLILPFILFRKLKKRSKNLHDLEVYAKYSFVYEGLKKNRYYWEFVNVFRKMIVIVIGVFLNLISIQTQVFFPS